MKKRLMTLIATLLTAAGSVSAQGQFPSVYKEGYMKLFGDARIDFFYNTWGEIINGMSGQCLGLKAPGAKKICSTIISDEDPEYVKKCEHELHPNGLMKKAVDGTTKTFNYDKQWRLQNIMIKQEGWDRETIYKYVYDKNNRLAMRIDESETIYKYDANNNLTEIMVGEIGPFCFKNNKLTQLKQGDFSLTLSYDQQGRWTGCVKICPEYDETTSKEQVTFKYTGNDIFPSSITKRTGKYNPRTKKEIRTYSLINYQSTFTFDSKGNWTKWRVKRVSGKGYDHESFTITRTITYYTDEEVKKAVSELEQARKGSTTNGNQENESLWEF